MAEPRLRSLRAAGHGLRRRLRLGSARRASGFAGALAMFLGVVLVGDAIVTVVWEDPITAVFAQQRQKALEDELEEIEQAPLSASTLRLVKETASPKERMALLAGQLGARTETGRALGRISLPRIGKSFVFVFGTGDSSLKKGPGHYAGTALPGQRGTVGIAGHRTTYLGPFRRLDRMRSGDRIVLTMPYGRFTYAVEGKQVVSPSHTSVLRRVRHDRLVLTTCTPLFSAKQRLVVKAKLERTTPIGQAIQFTPVAPTAPL